MNLLLDTHVLLWWLDEDARLPPHHRALLENRRQPVAVSIASLWEMTIKAALGKLELQDDLPTIEAILQRQDIAILPIQIPHLERLLELPRHHRDPFDRLIIAQAIAEHMTLLSDDDKFSAYPVKLLHTGEQAGR